MRDGWKVVYCSSSSAHIIIHPGPVKAVLGLVCIGLVYCIAILESANVRQPVDINVWLCEITLYSCRKFVINIKLAFIISMDDFPYRLEIRILL